MSSVLVKQTVHVFIFDQYFLIKVFQENFQFLVLLNHLADVEIDR
jgi:hypothetical protein